MPPFRHLYRVLITQRMLYHSALSSRNILIDPIEHWNLPNQNVQSRSVFLTCSNFVKSQFALMKNRAIISKFLNILKINTKIKISYFSHQKIGII